MAACLLLSRPSSFLRGTPLWWYIRQSLLACMHNLARRHFPRKAIFLLQLAIFAS